jgi:ABC-type sulfate/molybdate transport systems ATPase subunit
MPGEARLSVRARVAGEIPDRPRLDVDLTFGSGIAAVMGPSGAGKTTLLTAIAGLVRPDAGRIALGDTVLFDRDARTFVPPHERRIALVFQSLALFPHLSARENVAYGLRAKTRAERRDQAMLWLTRCRVEHLADRVPASLSGGEAQRVALARALASAPRVLLLDEPFSALDRVLRSELSADLGALVSELGIIAVLVTHHEEDAQTLGSRRVTLSDGRVEGTSNAGAPELTRTGPAGAPRTLPRPRDARHRGRRSS